MWRARQAFCGEQFLATISVDEAGRRKCCTLAPEEPRVRQSEFSVLTGSEKSTVTPGVRELVFNFKTVKRTDTTIFKRPPSDTTIIEDS